MLGCIGYLATTVRLGMAFTASTLGQVSSNPGGQYVKYARRALGYLLCTANYTIRYSHTLHASTNQIITYADASYACSSDNRSQIFMMNGGPIVFTSTCRKFTTMSSQEAETVAAHITYTGYISNARYPWIGIPNTMQTHPCITIKP